MTPSRCAENRSARFLPVSPAIAFVKVISCRNGPILLVTQMERPGSLEPRQPAALPALCRADGGTKYDKKSR